MLTTGDRILGVTDSSYYSIGNQFYANNSDSIKSSAYAMASVVDWDTIEQNVSSFVETSKVLIGLLDEVEKIHPFIHGT
jgi:hypothetical protein